MLCFRIGNHVFVGEPRSPNCISAAFWPVFISKHQCSGFASHAIACDYDVTSHLGTVLKNNTCFVVVLPVLLDSMAQIDFDTNFPGVVKDNLVQLAPMPVEVGCCLVARRGLLVEYYFPSIPLVDVEAIICQVDGYLAHLTRNATAAPACEDTASVRPRCDYVAEYLELRKGFVDNGCVTMSNAFDCRGETTEP